MRRLLPALVGLVLVVGGIYALLTVVNHRDSGELQTDLSGQGPGTPESTPGNPPTSGTVGTANLTHETVVGDPELVHALALGDVAFVYGTPHPPSALVRLRDEQTGAFDPELAAAGQTAILVHRRGVRGIQALAWKRRYQASGPADPRLREFVDAWLGKGRGQTG